MPAVNGKGPGGSRGESLTEQIPVGDLDRQGTDIGGTQGPCLLDEGSPYAEVPKTRRDDGYWVMTMPSHPLAQAGGKVRVHRAVAFDIDHDIDHDGKIACGLCQRDDLDWAAKRPDPAFVAVDHVNHDRSDNRASNLRRTHDWCNNNRPVVDQLGIPWETFTDTPIPARKALRNTRTTAPTSYAYSLAGRTSSTLQEPQPTFTAVPCSPWDDVFTVPASLLETYPFLAEVRP